MQKITIEALADAVIRRRAVEIFDGLLRASHRQTDRMFSWLLAFQYAGGILAAVFISPKAWEGLSSHIHIHVWLAVFLGGTISGFPIYLARRQRGAVFTRHVIAAAQMLTSALLIHLSGGRLETHFHVFGSLAILAFYKDWRVLMTATAVVAADHAVRGIFWPVSVFGILASSPWRWVEHAAWVLFEDVFLLLSIKQSLGGIFGVAERQARLESINEVIENKVVERTLALSNEVAERSKAERQLSLEYAVSRIMAESASIESSGQRVLEVIGESVQRVAGILWMTDHRDGVLRCAQLWHVNDPQIAEFCAACRNISFVKGAGLPGRVWAGGTPLFDPNLGREKDSAREITAERANLCGAFAFPIVEGDRVSGVIEFISRGMEQPDQGMMRTCAGIGAQLGRSAELKRVQAHLLQSQKNEMIGKMAGGIAHEFNSLMTAIIGESDLLLGDLPTDSPLRYGAAEIGKAADKAAGLTRQLLAYGRKQIFCPRVLNLNQVLAGMEGTLRHLMGRGTETSIVPAKDLQPLRADAGQIEQVILFLAMNAADAMPNGGKLVFETSNITLGNGYFHELPDLVPGPYVMLAVTDTGVGMSPEVKARAFEPFFSTKEIGKGTGLGLPTCQGIIEQSGGYIAVYSELGRGTTVKVYLPQVGQEAKAPAEGGFSTLPRGSETILLAEDEPSLRDTSVRILARLGYKVLAASDGVEALRLAHQQGVGHIDLLFTDVVMPQMCGKELSERFRSFHPRAKIIFTSAYGENAIVHQGIVNPGIILLPKPFTPAALAIKVREVLDEATSVCHNGN